MFRITAIFALLGFANMSAAEGLLTAEADVFGWEDELEISSLDRRQPTSSKYGQAWYRDTWDLSGDMVSTNGEFFSPQVESETDISHEVFSATDNRFLTLGLGWEGGTNVGLGGPIGGPGLLLEGRWGVAGWAYVYGQSAWLPELSDSSGRSTLSGYELEAGVSVEPFPFWSLRAGYRHIRFDYQGSSGYDSSSSVSGFLLGTGLHW
jgi:opacity protein-like surface antigen